MGSLIPKLKVWLQKIATLKEQESQGLIKPKRTDDLLGMALGKDEHPGWVWCAGLGVSSKQKRHRCVCSSQKEVEGLKGQVSHLQNQVDELQKIIMEMKGRNSEVEHNNVSTHESSSLKEPCSNLEPAKGEWIKCELYWPDLTIVVAKGRVFIPEVRSYAILHGNKLDSKSLKVTVDTVEIGQEQTIIPYTSEEDCNTSKARSAGKPGQSKNTFLEHAQSQQGDLVSRISSMLASIDKLDVIITMPTNVLQHEHFLHIGKKELTKWLKGKKLDVVHIALYMRCLCENHNSEEYAFLFPEHLAWPVGKDHDRKKRAKYMAQSMLNVDLQGRLWFSPYNGGLHWILAVIDPDQNIIYWLDPLGCEVRTDFMELATMAMKKFNKKIG